MASEHSEFGRKPRRLRLVRGKTLAVIADLGRHLRPVPSMIERDSVPWIDVRSSWPWPVRSRLHPPT
jgi:hypothetical protein